MKSKLKRGLVAVGFMVALCVTMMGPKWMHAQAPSSAAKSPENAPIESDMHEFMEYYFQPTYLRLKASMASPPTNNQGWRDIKSGSLILAEGGNLLLQHKPDSDVPAWNEFSTQVRALGGQLYQAGKKKDFDAARKHYEAMLVKCNACHQKFADGEHQLKP